MAIILHPWPAILIRVSAKFLPNVCVFHQWNTPFLFFIYTSIYALSLKQFDLNAVYEQLTVKCVVLTGEARAFDELLLYAVQTGEVGRGEDKGWAAGHVLQLLDVNVRPHTHRYDGDVTVL